MYSRNPDYRLVVCIVYYLLFEENKDYIVAIPIILFCKDF